MINIGIHGDINAYVMTNKENL